MTDAGAVTADQLRSFVERIEQLNEEIGSQNDDKKLVYAEAKANGFDVKALKRLVQLRKKPAQERAEEDAVLDLYMAALGMTGADDAAG
ncbi:MAG: DUF2312 domain-containing protein [Roseibium sp.]|nr:DUF2312 domain-containing protein [Roseibium sp.]